MALNNAAADLAASSICDAMGIAADDTATRDQYQKLARALYAALKTDIQINVTVTSVSGVTSGGAVSGPGTGTGVPL